MVLLGCPEGGGGKYPRFFFFSGVGSLSGGKWSSGVTFRGVIFLERYFPGGGLIVLGGRGGVGGSSFPGEGNIVLIRSLELLKSFMNVPDPSGSKLLSAGGLWGREGLNIDVF